MHVQNVHLKQRPTLVMSLPSLLTNPLDLVTDFNLEFSPDDGISALIPSPFTVFPT